MFNCILFGILIVQTYAYFKAQQRDSVWIRMLVGTVFLLDVLQTVLTMHCLWFDLILGWGNSDSFINRPWSYLSLPILSGIISAIVQIFFAWQIWILKKSLLSRSIVILIIIIALFQCFSDVAFCIQSTNISVLDMVKFLPVILCWFIGQIICDIFIATTMVYMLVSAKTSYLFVKTTNLIDQLIIQAIRTGSITTIAVIVQLILFVTHPDNFVPISMLFFMSKLSALNGMVYSSNILMNVQIFQWLAG
ncbi:hypothetical protein H2248_007336 [Termitomyces sp. 'cryptogamus']|nr:hypothetical protein H2248_007336 [Termitomyces sp. 'cryptogamus']